MKVINMIKKTRRLYVNVLRYKGEKRMVMVKQTRRLHANVLRYKGKKNGEGNRKGSFIG